VNPDLRKEIWAEMQAVGDRLRGVLQPDPRHPAGRNPHAHVAGCVKEKFGCSYRELPDEKAGELRQYLRDLEAGERSSREKPA
jgi:hypothetical protein